MIILIFTLSSLLEETRWKQLKPHKLKPVKQFRDQLQHL